MTKKQNNILSALSASQRAQRNKGFTLVELLVVIGIIAILFAVVLVAINPAKRFAEANNARRLTDVNSILNGILNYTVDKKGALPPGMLVTSTGAVNYKAVAPRVLGSGAPLSGPVSCTGLNTCNGNGFGSCTVNADCDNTCTETSAASGVFTCKLTGLDCTGSGATLCSDANNDDICDDGAAIPTNAPNGRATQCGGLATPVCSNNICSSGPLVGRYCNIDADCRVNANTPICSSTQATPNQIYALAKYNLGDSAEGVVPTYLASVPTDPGNSLTAPKYYAIENVKGTGRIHVIACNPDTIDGATNVIEVIR